MGEAPPRRTGLGRGLQALLPHAGEQSASPAPADWLAPSDDALSPRLGLLVEAGLDVLERAIGVDVCGYVHGTGSGRPHLWLRPGPSASLTASEWVELGMAAVGAVLGSVRMPRSLVLGSTELLAVPARGPASSGVHIVGRSGHGLSDHERTVAIHLVQAMGEALHGLLPEQEGRPEQEDAPEPFSDAAPGPDELVTAAEAAPVPTPLAVTAQWPAAIDLEELVRNAVQASGVHHTELDVRLLADRGADVIDVAAAHRGDRVRVVLTTDPDDPAHTAAQAAVQTVNLLQLIGAEAAVPAVRP